MTSNRGHQLRPGPPSRETAGAGQQKHEIKQGQIPSPVLEKEEPFVVVEVGAAGMGSSSAERQVGSELNVRQQSTLAREKATSFQEYGQ